LVPPPSIITAFAALTVALAALWLPRREASAAAALSWTLPFALALAAALYGGLVDVLATVVLLFFAMACRAASRARGTALRVASHALMLAITAGLLLHVMPGFHNPVVIDGIVLSPGGVPYTKYLNFDKGAAGLFLLGLYAPSLTQHDRALHRVGGWLWRFLVMVAVVGAVSLAVGFVRWDPKLPVWFPMWAWSMVFLTALPEEAVFRGVVQTGLEATLGRHGALAAAAVLFGAAHIGGGPLYVGMATLAGAFYGWIYMSTRSLSGAILAHAGLNTVHLLLFTYPALGLHA
jgi:membrane protease YdiL (CAAX protease family)